MPWLNTHKCKALVFVAFFLYTGFRISGLFAQNCMGAIPAPTPPQYNGLWAGSDKTIVEENESVEFRMLSNAYGTATYTISKDRYADTPLATGQVTLNPGVMETVNFQLDHPGFLRFELTQNYQSTITAVAVKPCAIGRVDSLPPDFDSFWAGLKTQLSTVPINPQLTYRGDKSDGQQTTYKMTLDIIDGRKVQGWISFPNCWLQQPAIIALPSYGTQPITPFTWVAARGAIVVSLSIHDHDPEQTVPGSLAYQPACHYVDRETNYFKWAILGIIRTIDYLETLPEYNGAGVALTGKSQGAGLAVIGAGLDNRVVAVSQSQAALSDHEGLLHGRSSGFPYWVRNYVYCSSATEEEVREAMGYYSVPNFATRYAGPSLNAVGYTDEICPPSTIFSVYNSYLSSQKTMIHGVDKGHNGVNAEYDAAESQFLATQLTMIPASSCPVFIVPLTLISFSGAAKANGNLLEWITENEEMTATFVIEKSTDGRRFQAIGTVPAQGFSVERTHYSFLDEAVKTSAYYRLRMLDQDGTTSFSDIIFLAHQAATDPSIEVYPNPFNSQLTFQSNTLVEAAVEVLLYDNTGRFLEKSIWEGSYSYQLEVPKLPAGVYIYQLRFSNGKSKTGRLICSKL